MAREWEACQLIERSIITKFRKTLWRPFIYAVKTYELIRAGDRIAGTVVGIGVNCTTDAFPPELRDIACSLGGDISRNALAAGIIAELLPLSENLRSPELIAEYRRRSYTLGRRIAFERGGRTVFATADSINDNGNLVAREPDGTLTVLFSGEATLA